MLKQLLPLARRSLTNATACQVRHARVGGVYEPDYLDSLKPKYPQYESVNLQIKGYDYPVLESYQSFLHSVAEYLDIDVEDAYAMPPQHITVQRFRPNSSVVDAEYKLCKFERNLQLNDVSAPIYPILLRVAEQALPEGVELTVHEHTDEEEDRRYVPDKELLDLKSELERMQSGQIKKS